MKFIDVQQVVERYRITREQLPDTLVNQVISFLESGQPTAAAPGVVWDKIARSAEPIGISPTAFTDGEWHWTNELTYYVKKYHVMLPSDLLEYVKNKV